MFRRISLVLGTLGAVACSADPQGLPIAANPRTPYDAGSTPGEIADLDSGQGSAPTDDAAASDPPDSGDQSTAGGLPCSVDRLLQTYCRGCHSDPPVQHVARLRRVTCKGDDLLAALGQRLRDRVSDLAGRACHECPHGPGS